MTGNTRDMSASELRAWRAGVRKSAEADQLARLPWPPVSANDAGRAVEVVGTVDEKEVTLRLPPIPDWRENSGVFWAFDSVLYMGATAGGVTARQQRTLRSWFHNESGWVRLRLPQRAPGVYTAVASAIGRGTEMYPTHSHLVRDWDNNHVVRRLKVLPGPKGSPDAVGEGERPWGEEWYRALLCPGESAPGVVGDGFQLAPLDGAKCKRSVVIENQSVRLLVHPAEFWFARTRVSKHDRVGRGVPAGYPECRRGGDQAVCFERDSLFGIFGYWMEIAKSRVVQRGGTITISGPICMPMVRSLLAGARERSGEDNADSGEGTNSNNVEPE